ncbi:MAG: endonuclease/exonuclease/phosphatase family protein [Alphaproteobacteria bacterium]
MGGLIGLLWLGVGGGALAIAAAELAPIWPIADTASHFRPHLAIFVGTFALAALPVGRWAIFIVGALASGWATLAVTSTGSCEAPAGEGGGPAFSVLSFNILASNLDLEDIEQRIREADADAVILIEYGPVHTPLGTALADIYPGQIDCAQTRGCRMALMARRPFTLAQTMGRDQGTPPIVSARFALGEPEADSAAGDGAAPADEAEQAAADSVGFTLVGTHLSRPFDGSGRWQARDVDSLIAAMAGLDGPLVVAGDFNATPWSRSMRTIRESTGLCGAAGYRPTWPVWLGALGLPIDHILVSPDLAVTAETLPPAGSDHLPIRAVVTAR